MFLLSIHTKKNLPINKKIKLLYEQKKKILEKLNFPKCIKKNNHANVALKYIAGVCIHSKNLYTYLSDTQGNIFFSISSGFLSTSISRYNRRSFTAIKKIIKWMSNRMYAIKMHSITLHMSNLKKAEQLLVIKTFNRKFMIEQIKIYDNIPHNGCRPRKIKRSKKNLSF